MDIFFRLCKIIVWFQSSFCSHLEAVQINIEL